MEGFFALFHQLTAHVPIFDSCLDEVEQAAQQISSHTSCIDICIDEFEGIVHVCEA